MAKEGQTLVERDVRREITQADFERVFPKIVARFRKAGATEADACDLAQETLLKAYRNLHTFAGRAEFDTWVIAIAKRTWSQFRRDQQRIKRSAEEVSLAVVESTPLEPRASEDVEQAVISRDLLARARRGFEQLPAFLREPFLLSLNGQKYREIATLLRIPENRVASLIHQAREKLRREASS